MISFREATIDDIDNDLINLYMEGYNIHYEKRPDYFKISNSIESSLELFSMIKNGESIFLLILLDNKIIGFLAYFFKGMNKEIIWISQLVIGKEYRNKGYGRKLIEELRRIGKELNCKRIELNCWSFNDEALNFYKGLDFKEQRVIFESEI